MTDLIRCACSRRIIYAIKRNGIALITAVRTINYNKFIRQNYFEIGIHCISALFKKVF